MAERTRVQLPPGVAGDFEVFLNGVRQVEGRDFRHEPGELVFERPLVGEGRLGFWRWLSLFLGVAGTYRQDGKVDVIYEVGGRRAVRGISLRHSGHSRTVSSTGGSVFRRAISTFTGLTTKKKTAAAIETNVIRALMKSPYRKRLLWIVNESAEKSCLPTIAAMIGVIRSVTRAVTSAANAIPITIPTARSTRFPRSKNVRNSFTSACIVSLLESVEGLSRLLRDSVQLVADAVARLDERVPRCAPVDLLP